jgi:hypothetical protein
MDSVPPSDATIQYLVGFNRFGKFLDFQGPDRREVGMPLVEQTGDKKFSVDLSDLDFIDTLGFDLLQVGQQVSVGQLIRNLGHFAHQLYYIAYAFQHQLCMTVKVYEDYEAVCCHVADFVTPSGIFVCHTCAEYHEEGGLEKIERPECATEGCTRYADYFTADGEYLCESCLTASQE